MILHAVFSSKTPLVPVNTATIDPWADNFIYSSGQGLTICKKQGRKSLHQEDIAYHNDDTFFDGLRHAGCSSGWEGGNRARSLYPYLRCHQHSAGNIASIRNYSSCRQLSNRLRACAGSKATQQDILYLFISNILLLERGLSVNFFIIRDRWRIK